MSEESPSPRHRATKKTTPATKKSTPATKKSTPAPDVAPPTARPRARKAAPPPVPHPPPSETADTEPIARTTPPPQAPPSEVPAAVAAVAIEEAVEQEVHESHDEGSGRLRTGFAILVALISIAGALVTWRAEVAGSEAGRADREGTIVSVTAEGDRQEAEAQARAEARAAQRAYEAYAAAQLYKKERDATTGAASSAADTRFAQEDAVALKLLDGYFVLDFVAHDEDGYVTNPKYDVEGRVADLLAQGQSDADSERFFEEADEMEGTRAKLFGLDVVLVLALALVAIAQVNRRRRVSLMWAAPGLVLFVVATALFITTET